MAIDIGKGVTIYTSGDVNTFKSPNVSSSKAYRRSRKKKRRAKRYSSRSKRHTHSFRKKKGRRYTPHTAGKRKDTSHRRIRYTKRGQPYVIMGNGKARFISLRSAKSSHKRKGGKY